MAVVAEVEAVAAGMAVVGETATNFAFGMRSGPGSAGPRAFYLAASFPAGLWDVAVELRPTDTLKPMKEQPLEVEGRVQTVLPGTMFRVELDNKHLVLATISGKMRKRWVRLTVGDRVKMEMSPYDLDKARIVWRLR